MVHEQNDMVVVTEDSTGVECLLKWLEAHHYFTHLTHPDGALATIKQTRPALVLIDGYWPGGWTLASKLRAEKVLRKSKLILTLPPGGELDATKASANQIDALLFHPLSEHAVIHTLNSLKPDGEPKMVPATLFLSTAEFFRKKPLLSMQTEEQKQKATTASKSITANLRRLNSELESELIRCRHEIGVLEKDLESFAYSVSHDLRAPLRAIEGFSRIVTEDYAQNLDAEGQKLLGYIQNNSQQMMHLIEDIVQYYRTTRCKISRSPQNVMEMARSVWQELTSQGTGNAPELVANKMSNVLADGKALRHVISELLSNAIKFSGRTAQPRVEIGANDGKDEVVFYVKDNGVGFEMQYAHKLFKLFQRMRPAGEFEGNGTGLALVQRLISRHGGRVWAEGVPDVGATFFFALPKN